MSDKERTPLIRGSGGHRHKPKQPSYTSSFPARPGMGQRQRSAGEVFTLDDDQRILHRPTKSDASEPELHRDYSRFLLYGGSQNSRKNSGASGSSGGCSGGGVGGGGSGRTHKRQWSVATEPTRNLSLAKAGTVGTDGATGDDAPVRVQDGRGNQKSSNGDADLLDLVEQNQQKQEKMAVISREDPGYAYAGRMNTRKKRTKTKFDRGYYVMMKEIVVVLSYTILAAYTGLVLFGPLFLLPIEKGDWCPEHESIHFGQASAGDDDTIYEDPHYENPDYITDPCFHLRLPQLLGLTLEECDLSRRMLASVIFGGAIGYERRASDRPAGIRTMGLVSLGSCFFTISSQLAFKSSTMGWDASRVTAAIPTGVGFLGAGLIWKGTVGAGPDEVHQVHGLTTAASLWLSAAVGAGAGGALYFVAGYSVILVIIILRYGPKLYFQDDASYNDDEDEDTMDDELKSINSNEEVDDAKKREARLGVEGSGNLYPAWKATKEFRPLATSGIKATGRADEVSYEGDESCPSFVSFTDLHAEATEEEKLRTSTPPPYGSVEHTDSEWHSILKTPGTAESARSGKRVQIMFDEIPLPPLGREISEARSIASSSRKRPSKSPKQKRKKAPSKRPTFHS